MKGCRFAVAVVTVIIGIVQAAPGHPDKCLGAVSNSCPRGLDSAKRDCASFLYTQVLPCAITEANTKTITVTAKAKTTTSSITKTASDITTSICTKTIHLPQTTTESSTVTEFSTTKTTEVQTATVTSFLSVTGTVSTTTTTTIQSTTTVEPNPPARVKRAPICHASTNVPYKVPEYASVCERSSYASACKFHGVRPSLVILSPPTITQYATKTITTGPTHTVCITTTTTMTSTSKFTKTISVTDVISTVTVALTTIILTTITEYSTKTASIGQTTTVTTITEVATATATSTVAVSPPFILKSVWGSQWIYLDVVDNIVHFTGQSNAALFTIDPTSSCLYLGSNPIQVSQDSPSYLAVTGSTIDPGSVCLMCGFGGGNQLQCSADTSFGGNMFSVLNNEIRWTTQDLFENGEQSFEPSYEIMD